jgi:hypothetical protein
MNKENKKLLRLKAGYVQHTSPILPNFRNRIGFNMNLYFS